jgi:hypothetical protein
MDKKMFCLVYITYSFASRNSKAKEIKKIFHLYLEIFHGCPNTDNHLNSDQHASDWHNFSLTVKGLKHCSCNIPDNWIAIWRIIPISCS